MTFNDYLWELTFPFRNLGTNVAVIAFFLLFKLALAAGLFGFWLLVMVLPAFMRYLVLVAQARARGIEADPPGIEYFSLVGNWWTLFPFVHAFVLGRAYVWVNTELGGGSAAIFALVVATIVPAMMAVLVITQSPVQSLNPLALWTLIRETGNDYWYAPTTLLLAFLITPLIDVLPFFVVQLAELYLLVSFYAVTGAITRERKLIDEVDIEDPIERDAEDQVADLLRERTTVLNHAYGFASRGNREGGLSHIYGWLMKDPDPVEAWPWFFAQMLKWEENEHALWFAQEYIHWLLARNDQVPAVKVIMRCRLLNERFRPRPADMDAAISAAQNCGNQELAEALQRL